MFASRLAFTAGSITGGHGVRAVGKINPVFLQRKVGAAGAMEHMGAAVSDVTAALVFRGVGLNGRVFGCLLYTSMPNAAMEGNT